MSTRVFFSYSPKDGALRDELVAHLEILRAKGILTTWSEQDTRAGDNWREVARREIEAADLVLLLVSADFLASEYCRDTEVRSAWSRHEAGKARVVPVVLRPCLWEEATFGTLKPLPADGRPVTRWESRDEAWLDVARGIRTIAKERETPPAAARDAAPRDVDGAFVPPNLADGTSRAPPVPPRRREMERWLVEPSGPSPGNRIAPPPGLSASPRGPSMPPQSQLDRWLLELEAWHAEKRNVPPGGKERAKIQATIDELKRKLREGGQLQQGDSLGDDGRYYLLHQIGRGGFATVWEADDRKVGKRVALKVLHPHLAADPTRRERFFRGARAMEKTLHPGVVRVLVPYEEDAGFFYFVMELIEGVDLHRAVLAERMARDRVVRLILQAGEALIAAHEGGFVHRDVTPHNILLDADGDAKLTDFDLVAAAESTGGTRTGAMGKFLYAAPEVSSRPQDADARADVYGLAMTAIFCLYGADLPVRVIRKTEEFVAGLQCGPLAPVLLKAIEAEPSDRYASMQVFCEALRGASESKVLFLAPPPKARAAVGDVAATVTKAGAFGPAQEGRRADSPVEDASSDEPIVSPAHVPPAPIEDGASKGAPILVASSSLAEAPAPVASPAAVLHQVSFQRRGSASPRAPIPEADVAGSPSQQATFQRPHTPSEEDPLARGGLDGASSLGGISEPIAKPKPLVARSRLALVGGTALVLMGAVTAAVRYGPGVFPGSAESTPSASAEPISSGSSSASRCPPDMAYLPAGTFRMGSEKDDRGADDDERPAHDVTLRKPFCLDVAEVTVAKYRACTAEMRNGVTCAPYAGCNGARTDRDAHPINCIDWKMADTYCKWAGGALPTEAQWEYAARGKESRIYPWGNEPAPGSEFLKWNSSDGTAPVKNHAKGKTPEGVFDLAGNVWEWVADTYAPYDAAPSTDPLQNKGTLRTLRGGGWNSSNPHRVRSAFRNGSDEGLRNDDVGFRCAREPESVPLPLRR